MSHRSCLASRVPHQSSAPAGLPSPGRGRAFLTPSTPAPARSRSAATAFLLERGAGEHSPWGSSLPETDSLPSPTVCARLRLFILKLRAFRDLDARTLSSSLSATLGRDLRSFERFAHKGKIFTC